MHSIAEIFPEEESVINGSWKKFVFTYKLPKNQYGHTISSVNCLEREYSFVTQDLDIAIGDFVNEVIRDVLYFEEPGDGKTLVEQAMLGITNISVNDLTLN